MKLRCMHKLERVYLLSWVLEGTSPTVLTPPVYPEQAQCGQWGCLDFSVQHSAGMASLVKKKKTIQLKSFVQALLEVQRRSPKLSTWRR